MHLYYITKFNKVIQLKLFLYIEPRMLYTLSTQQNSVTAKSKEKEKIRDYKYFKVVKVLVCYQMYYVKYFEKKRKSCIGRKI